MANNVQETQPNLVTTKLPANTLDTATLDFFFRGTSTPKQPLRVWRIELRVEFTVTFAATVTRAATYTVTVTRAVTVTATVTRAATETVTVTVALAATV